MLCKKPQGDTIICRLIQCIWLHTQREDEANTGLRSPQRNRRSLNDAISKNKNKNSLTGWRHRLLWHCCKCATRGHISPIPIYYLPRLCAPNVNRFNFKNCFTLARSRLYPTQTITDTDIMLLAIPPTQTESLQHSLERATGGISLHVNADKFVCFNQKRDISTLNGRSLKHVEKFNYLRSSISATENDINMRIVKAWTAINRLLVIWKSDLSVKIKPSFFQAPHRCWLSVWRNSLTVIAQEMSCIGQILEVISYKTAAVRPPTTHVKNHPN